MNNEAALSFSKLLIAGQHIGVTVIANAEWIGRKLLYTWGNDMVAQLNQLILLISRTIPFRSNLDRHLIRAAMVFEFFAFSRRQEVARTPKPEGWQQPEDDGAMADHIGTSISMV